MSDDEKHTYLGDGVYVKEDGFGLLIWTDRTVEGRHWMVLGDAELEALFQFLERTRGLKITVEKKSTTR